MFLYKLNTFLMSLSNRLLHKLRGTMAINLIPDERRLRVEPYKTGYLQAQPCLLIEPFKTYAATAKEPTDTVTKVHPLILKFQDLGAQAVPCTSLTLA
mmetsp:Transcript_31634/g.50504  ORF Transcript_31634/g.50504 Transcript_31634/m.50504 type:complete len:98 (+) Transcript_31634:3715-4008(+)